MANVGRMTVNVRARFRAPLSDFLKRGVEKVAPPHKKKYGRERERQRERGRKMYNM